jgi:hypothetical protein
VKYYLRYRRLAWGFAAIACLALAGAGLALSSWLARLQQMGNFPGATLVADHTIYRASPHLSIRHDASYRTTAEFSKVYNWYSAEFDLGPESYAQSACILMARSTTVLLVVERQASVMVCDTPKGERLVFVMQSFLLRFW